MPTPSPERRGAASGLPRRPRPRCGPGGRPIDPERAAADAGRTERRAGPRSVSLEYRAWLGWWAGDDFRTIDARLLDIGRDGAAAEVDARPPRDRPLLFGLRGPAIAGGCVE